MSTQNMNLCRETSRYTHYEVIAYGDDRAIIYTPAFYLKEKVSF
jgi:hypothetical protein